MIEHMCKFCGKKISFETPNQVGGHVRNCKSNPKRNEYYVVLIENGKKWVKKRIITSKEKFELEHKKCLNCDKLISYDKRKNKFCNSSCSATYNNKLKIKKEKLIKRKKKEKIMWECPVCKKELMLSEYQVSKRKYCSGTCRNSINNKNINGSRSKAEIYLENELTKTFPDLIMFFNSRDILSGNKELDVYIPSLKLAVEWNGIFHYINCKNRKPIELIKEKDKLKIKECESLGIDLYIIKDLKSHKSFTVNETKKLIEYIKNKIIHIH